MKSLNKCHHKLNSWYYDDLSHREYKLIKYIECLNYIPFFNHHEADVASFDVFMKANPDYTNFSLEIPVVFDKKFYDGDDDGSE